MNNAKFEDWETDLKRGQALHHTGLCLRIEGDPKDPSAVTPINFSGLSFGDQARLLREGLAALAAAARKHPSFTPEETEEQHIPEAHTRANVGQPESPTLTMNR